MSDRNRKPGADAPGFLLWVCFGELSGAFNREKKGRQLSVRHLRNPDLELRDDIGHDRMEDVSVAGGLVGVDGDDGIP